MSSYGIKIKNDKGQIIVSNLADMIRVESIVEWTSDGQTIVPNYNQSDKYSFLFCNDKTNVLICPCINTYRNYIDPPYDWEYTVSYGANQRYSGFPTSGFPHILIGRIRSIPEVIPNHGIGIYTTTRDTVFSTKTRTLRIHDIINVSFSHSALSGNQYGWIWGPYTYNFTPVNGRVWIFNEYNYYHYWQEWTIFPLVRRMQEAAVLWRNTSSSLIIGGHIYQRKTTGTYDGPDYPAESRTFRVIILKEKD